MASVVSDRLWDAWFGMFEVTSIGVRVLAVGSLYRVTGGRRRMPAGNRPEQDRMETFRMPPYRDCVRVAAG